MKEAAEQDNSPKYDERPWGSFTVLDEGRGYKVKRIEVLPKNGSAISDTRAAPNTGSSFKARHALRSTEK
jgi:mannose-6-phosphate isomerase-like protein (cupin superfamily)